MKDLYKYINEGILDDEDVLIKKTDAPKPPKVSEKDYIYYAQAWYDVLEEALDNPKNDNQKNWAEVVKVYKEWQSEWTCFVSFEDYDDNIEDWNWYTSIDRFVEKTPKYEMDLMNNYLDDIIEEFELEDGDSRLTSLGSNSLLVAIFGDENVFRIEALNYGMYKKGPYKKFYNIIKKRLNFCGIR